MNKAAHVIAAQPRQEFGNNASRRLRKSGVIPGIIYSRGKTPVAVTVKTDEWQVVSAHAAQLLTVQLEGKDIPALVKEVQFNYLKNYVYHIDFQEVDLNAEIKSTVPLHPFGEAYGAAHGGLLEQEIFDLPVLCRPADLPELIKVDVTALNIGDTLTVGQIVLPEGVKLNIEADAVVFHVVRPREEEVAAPAAEEGAAAAEPEAINEKKTEARAAEKESKEKK